VGGPLDGKGLLVDEARARRLADDELAAEIELYGDLVVAASESDGALTQSQIDDLLGVTHASS
jgi:hypothetical protein